MLHPNGAVTLKNYHGKDTRQGGFTLLELLMAIFIFAIVISSVYGAYRTTFLIVNSAEDQAEYGNMAQAALERLTSDLESYYFGEDGFLLGGKKEDDTGRADQLSFTSTSHLTFSKKEQPAGYAVIGYSAETDEETGLLRLYRIDKTFRPGAGREIDDQKGFLLCDKLTEVIFSYFDAEGNESEEWKSDKDGPQGERASQAKYPAMIKITLRFAESAGSENSIVFSTAVAMSRLSRTNTL